MNGMHFACYSGRLENAQKLVEICPSLLTAIDSKGNSACDYAKDSGHFQVAEWLLNQNHEFFLAHRNKNTDTVTTELTTSSKCPKLSRALAQLAETTDSIPNFPQITSLMMPSPSVSDNLRICEAFLTFASNTFKFNTEKPVIARIEHCDNALQSVVKSVGVKVKENSELEKYITSL